MVRVGIIGLGGIARSHCDAIAGLDNVEIVAVADLLTEKRAEFMEKYNIPKGYETHTELLQDRRVDAVAVVLGHQLHHQLTIDACNAGKHVLVEKPVAATIKEIEDIRNLAQEKQVVCIPGHNYVYEESLMRTRRLLCDGDLGRLVSVYVLYNIHHPEEVARRYPGVIRQILTHHSYILLFLAGAPRRCLLYTSPSPRDRG